MKARFGMLLPAAWSLDGWGSRSYPGPEGDLEDENYILAIKAEKLQVSGSPMAMDLPFQPKVAYPGF